MYIFFLCQFLVWNAAFLADVVMCGDPGAGLLRRMLWRLQSSVKVRPGILTVLSLCNPLQEGLLMGLLDIAWKVRHLVCGMEEGGSSLETRSAL